MVIMKCTGVLQKDRIRESSPPLFIDGWMKSSISFSANSYDSKVTTVKKSPRSSHRLLFESTLLFFLQFHDQKTGVTLFRPGDAASFQLDLEAEHKQNWV